MDINEVNKLSSDHFLKTFGNVIENWISAAQYAANHRPYKDCDHLCQAFYSYLDMISMQTKKSILECHPLIGSKGILTKESAQEQLSTGLTSLCKQEEDELFTLNKIYYDKFRFPFVICARQNNVQCIIDSLNKRLKNTEFNEIQIAIEEVKKILTLRIKDLVALN